MRKVPFAGTPVSYHRRIFSGSLRQSSHGPGGGIWCVGMSFNIIASGKTSPVIAYMSSDKAPLVVAAIWGILSGRNSETGKTVSMLVNPDAVFGLYCRTNPVDSSLLIL